MGYSYPRVIKMSLTLERGTGRNLLIFWLVLIAYGIIVSAFPFDYHDSDSSAYSRISQELAHEPILTWCAPQWWGHGGNQGLFRDHPPGLFWLPALLVRAGVKDSRAALCANFIYILLCLYFLYKLAGVHGDSSLGWAAVFGFVLTPIFMQYLIRANHEQPLNLAVVAGLYGLSRSSRSFRHQALFVAALIFAVFIKGFSAVILSILAFLFWLILSRNKKSFSLIVIAHVLMLAAVALFEGWYRGVTHSSFLSAYVAFQGGRTIQAAFLPLLKIYNFVWYAARVLWFSAPWVYFLFYGLAKYGKEKLALFKDAFIRFLLLGSLSSMAFISLSDRKADRYIFPAYLLFSLAGVYVLSRMKPGFLSFFRSREKRLPWILALGLVVFSFLSIFIDNHFYKFIRFWPK
jgi:4-amino-4-deoxy-L-arabinose transferase-like glycosyltransferase